MLEVLKKFTDCKKGDQYFVTIDSDNEDTLVKNIKKCYEKLYEQSYDLRFGNSSERPPKKEMKVYKLNSL